MTDTTQPGMLTRRQIQEEWLDACMEDSPIKPGSERHFRFANSIESLIIQAYEARIADLEEKVAVYDKRIVGLGVLAMKTAVKKKCAYPNSPRLCEREDCQRRRECLHDLQSPTNSEAKVPLNGGLDPYIDGVLETPMSQEEKDFLKSGLEPAPQQPTADALPPLPEPVDFGYRDGETWVQQLAFDHDQMRSYALASLQSTPRSRMWGAHNCQLDNPERDLYHKGMRALLYNEYMNDKRVLRDDLWIVTTGCLNKLHQPIAPSVVQNVGNPHLSDYAVSVHAYGGSTGINDYLMADGSVKAMRPREVKWVTQPSAIAASKQEKAE